MKEYLTDREKVLKALGSDESGLSQAEAQTRIQRDGKNALAAAEKETLLSRFLKQLKDPMLLVLLCAAVVSGATAAISGDSMADVFIILAVVLLNATLGVLQESKAEKAIEALQKMTKTTCRTLRDGQVTRVDAEELCVGDVILLEAGDAVPADARLLEAASLKVEEAALTGESVPAQKSADTLDSAEDVPLGDRSNMLYMGTTVVYGRAKAVLTATGMKTEMGRIADAIRQVTDEKTPLQIKLSKLSKSLSFLVLGICAFIFAFSLIRAGEFTGKAILDTFMIAVSLAVAAIPEGLATVVTVVLSIGVTNMSKRGAVIRKLTCVETLGCTQVICSDKTGTLTQNKMTVVKHTGEEKRLARAMALCSDAEWENGKAVGEPTECALVAFAHEQGLDKGDLKKEYPRVGEAPFDSERKRMSTLHGVNGIIIQYTKGAPDEVLKLCDSFYDNNGQVAPITESVRARILGDNKRMADEALRVLAAAEREYDETPADQSPDSLENHLTFIGLVGMIDPVRPEVVDAVARCRAAGVRPIMITGDHPDTAAAIGKQLHILESSDQAITGAQLSKMTDEELDRDIDKYRVYARVQPEHKVRIVEAFKKRGEITAMTGDGVNDAPAIKRADIGVGMGITGTDVTKNVADMVLSDDNFATIVVAVEEGRRIYDNIRKAIQFLLSSNLSEVLSVFVSTLFGFTILKPVHILFINLVTDTFPALALGVEKAEPGVMSRAPRRPDEGVFARGLGADAAYQGALIALVTVFAYFVGHFMEAGRWEAVNSPDGMTMAFLTMSLAEVFHAFNMRSQRGSVFNCKTHNLLLYGAMAFSLLSTAALIFIPALSGLFGFEPISLAEYAVAFLLAASVLPIVEGVKWAQRKAMKRK